jgi:hypothetical protein
MIMFTNTPTAAVMSILMDPQTSVIAMFTTMFTTTITGEA